MKVTTTLLNVYCDVLIGIGEHTRINRLSYTLREKVFEVAHSHNEAYELKTKPVEAHHKLVQEAQKFCKEQM